MAKKNNADGFSKNKIFEIKKQLSCSFFQPVHFLEICPYSIEELKSDSRMRDLVHWRNFGIVWMCLCGENATQSTRLFNRHHSTLYNCIKNVENALEAYDKPLLQKIKLVEAYSNELGYIRRKPLNLSAKEMILFRRKRIDPKLRIWNIREKYDNREKLFTTHEFIRNKWFVPFVQETDCN
jgi:hypothetical protein